MRELIAVAAEAAVATRVAATVSLNSFRGGAKHGTEDPFVFQLRHQPCATRHVVVEHDRGLAGMVSPAMVTLRSVSGTSSVSAAPSRTA